MILQYIFYFFLAYLAGGMMFGALIPKVFCGLDIREISKDGNPEQPMFFFTQALSGGSWSLSVIFLKVSFRSIWLQAVWVLRRLGSP